MAKFIDRYGTAFNKNFIFRVFVCAYAAFVIYLCYFLNVWIDEIYTLDTTSYSIGGVIKQSYDFEAQPPLYFVLLSLWRTIDPGIFFARLFSAAAVGLAAFVFHKLVHLISGKECPRWLLVIFLLNPFTVWACCEIRLYAFLLLLSLSSLYFFFKFYIHAKNKYLIIFAFTAVVGIYTQYLYVFFLASLGIAMLICKGWKIFFKFSLYLLPAALLFLQSLLFTSNPMKLAYIASFDISFTQRLLGVFHTPQDLLLAVHLVPFGRIIRWGIIAGFIFLAVYAYAKWYKKRTTVQPLYLERINVILISAGSLVFFISVFFAFTGLDYTHKYFSIGFPLLLLIFLVFDIYPVLQSRSIFLIIIAVYTIALMISYKKPVKDFDSKLLAEYLEQNENKQEPVLFYDKVLVLPLKYYYHGKNPLQPLPGNVQFDSTYFSKLKDTIELKQAIERINTPSGSYLLVTNRTEDHFKNDEDVKLINEYLPVHYNITLDTMFYGNNQNSPLRIRRLVKK
jgi:uncharacterized membrane protein